MFKDWEINGNISEIGLRKIAIFQKCRKADSVIYRSGWR